MRASGASSTHKCPGGCGADVPYSRLSCPSDWYRLPKVLRDEVNVAYRNRARDGVAHRLAIREVMRWYSDNLVDTLKP